jgi:hypothetical protein
MRRSGWWLRPSRTPVARRGLEPGVRVNMQRLEALFLTVPPGVQPGWPAGGSPGRLCAWAGEGIENDVRVTEDGGEMLTTLPRELIVV